MTSSQIRNSLWRRRVPATLTFIAVVALFVAVAVTRDPSWKSEARLNVGRADVTAQSIPGYSTGIQALAASFSRAIVATEVTEPVARALRVEPRDVESRLTASPIPDSTLILVEATGDSESQAIETANLGSRRLIEYVGEGSVGEEDASAALKQFRTAAGKLVAARSDLRELKRDDASQARQMNAEAAVTQYKLEAVSLSDRYRNMVTDSRPGASVRVLTAASFATSDRSSLLQRLIGTGVVVGLVLALLVALVPVPHRRKR